jgi:hypothetical protein
MRIPFKAKENALPPGHVCPILLAVNIGISYQN